MTSLELDSLSISYGDRLVVDEVTLRLEQGQVLALLGPSGCGKTSILRAVSGLVHPRAGRVLLGGEDVTALPPQRRNVGVVFQDHLLFPHMTVLANVAYGLSARRRPRAEARERALWALDLVGLADRAGQHPGSLSGGQSQRVALARALAAGPRLLLLDEPFSSLDVDLRAQMRQEVSRIVQSVGMTTLMVTHDREEAMSMADRVALVGGGRLVEDGPVETVFRAPRTRYAAEFFARANVVPATSGAGEEVLVLGQATRPDRRPAGERVLVAVRPEEIVVGAEGVDAELLESEWLGERTVSRWRVAQAGGEAVTLRVDGPGRSHATLPERGGMARLRMPDRVTLVEAADD